MSEKDTPDNLYKSADDRCQEVEVVKIDKSYPMRLQTKLILLTWRDLYFHW